MVSQIRLEVRTVPSRVTNMSVHTNSVFAIGSYHHDHDDDKYDTNENDYAARNNDFLVLGLFCLRV